MTQMTYAEQLKHPKWQRKRLEILEGAAWKCTDCGSGEKTLHVHHEKYIKGRMAWEYENEELVALCDQCHEQRHDIKAELDDILSGYFGETQIRECMFGFLGGFLFGFREIEMEQSLKAMRLAKGFFEIGFMVSALGPTWLADALRRKVASGALPSNEIVESILNFYEAIGECPDA